MPQEFISVLSLPPSLVWGSLAGVGDLWGGWEEERNSFAGRDGQSSLLPLHPAAWMMLLPARDSMAWRWLWQHHSCNTGILHWWWKVMLSLLCRTSRDLVGAFSRFLNLLNGRKTPALNGIFTLLKGRKFLASAWWKQTFTLITRTSSVLPTQALYDSSDHEAELLPGENSPLQRAEVAHRADLGCGRSSSKRSHILCDFYAWDFYWCLNQLLSPHMLSLKLASGTVGLSTR